MSDQTTERLQDAIESAGGAVALLRDLGVGRFTALPDEYTHWIEEQRAWRESVALADQSYHMTDLRVEGPDALALYDDVGVNDFDGFEPGKAKQLVTCNPEGYFVGDVILLSLDEDEFLSVGAAPAHNWLCYHADTGDYDVTTEFQGRPVATGEDPDNFRFQLQGPDAVDVMDAVTDDPLPDLGFFNFAEASVDGRPVNVLRHGMAGERGYEFWGSYEDGEAVKETVLEAGEEHDIRRLGSLSYQTANVVLGWIPLPVPAVYGGESTREFREWISPRRGILSIGGSFETDDVSDYYLTPVELGYGHVVDFDGDFIGRDALEEKAADPDRTKVTFEWHPEDVLEVFGSLFESGETDKYLDLPHPREAACPHDAVRKDGEFVGFSMDKSYVYNERAMLSLGVVDVEHSDPGTEVTIVWGEPEGSENPVVERHTHTGIRATVATAPYREDRR